MQIITRAASMTSVNFTMVSNMYKRGYDGKQMLRILILVGELTLAGLAVVWRMGSRARALK
jgi:hypothetical protein